MLAKRISILMVILMLVFTRVVRDQYVPTAKSLGSIGGTIVELPSVQLLEEVPLVAKPIEWPESHAVSIDAPATQPVEEMAEVTTVIHLPPHAHTPWLGSPILPPAIQTRGWVTVASMSIPDSTGRESWFGGGGFSGGGAGGSSSATTGSNPTIASDSGGVITDPKLPPITTPTEGPVSPPVVITPIPVSAPEPAAISVLAILAIVSKRR